jgi:hypothetical protein
MSYQQITTRIVYYFAKIFNSYILEITTFFSPTCFLDYLLYSDTIYSFDSCSRSVSVCLSRYPTN